MSRWQQQLADTCPDEEYEAMKKRIDRTAPERVARYEVRKKDAGLVRVHVWVPADQRDALLAYAAKLRGK